jgi:hypothetical protein
LPTWPAWTAFWVIAYTLTNRKPLPKLAGGAVQQVAREDTGDPEPERVDSGQQAALGEAEVELGGDGLDEIREDAAVHPVHYVGQRDQQVHRDRGAMPDTPRRHGGFQHHVVPSSLAGISSLRTQEGAGERDGNGRRAAAACSGVTRPASGDELAAARAGGLAFPGDE